MSTANLLIGVGTNVSSKFVEYKFQAQHMKHFCGHCFEFVSVFVSITNYTTFIIRLIMH